MAKSASVKALCNQLGMRLVDLRVSFMSRLDFEGLTEIIKNGKNSVSYSCPTDTITTCTDGFINFARESIPVIEAKIADPGLNEEEKLKLQKVLEEFKESAKTPVLFFDEILRSDPSIRNALVKILNDKKFMGMKMSIARIITAANFPTDSKPGVEDLYFTGGVEDVAFLDRFEAIAVSPEETAKPWRKWAETKTDSADPLDFNIHTRVLDFLDRNVNLTYDFSEVEAAYERDGDPDKLSTMPFPTYRTWTMVSDYLKKIQKLRKDSQTPDEVKINPEVVNGLIGSKVGGQFLSYLERNGELVSSPSEEESLDKFVEDSLDANVRLAD